MKVFLASLQEYQQAWEGDGFIARLAHLLSLSKKHSQADDPELADAILFLENNITKSIHDFRAFSNTEILRRWSHKAYTLNYADTPVSFLPGLYVSLPMAQHDAKWTAAIPYPWPSPNPYLAGFQSTIANPGQCVTFRGSMSHPVRNELINLFDQDGQLVSIQNVDRWFNHSDEEQLDYLNEIANSKFVLCPRGIGTSTYRLYEALRLARVPVIISDEWVPPEGIDWLSCSIRLAEDRLRDLPSAIRSYLERWPDMSQAAARTWHSAFDDSALADYLFNRLEALMWIKRPFDDWTYLEQRWNSSSFRRQNKWDSINRLKRLPARLQRLCRQLKGS